jgi:WD40 repeat protein
VVSGKVVATLAAHTGPVSAVAFSPDGTRIVIGYGDMTARLWNAATGKVVATLVGHAAPIGGVAFSPDGTRVVTGSWDNTARLWSVSKSVQDLIDIVRTSVLRCLTPMQREAFHLGTPPPRWCYERNLWPFADHGQSDTGGGSPPYGPPAATWDERLLAGSVRGSEDLSKDEGTDSNSAAFSRDESLVRSWGSDSTPTRLRRLAVSPNFRKHELVVLHDHPGAGGCNPIEEPLDQCGASFDTAASRPAQDEEFR